MLGRSSKYVVGAILGGKTREAAGSALQENPQLKDVRQGMSTIRATVVRQVMKNPAAVELACRSRLEQRSLWRSLWSRATAGFNVLTMRSASTSEKPTADFFHAPTLTVVGTGHTGHVYMALAREARFQTRWFTLRKDREAELRGKYVVLKDQERNLEVKVQPHLLTSNPEKAIRRADIILLATSMDHWEHYMHAIAPYLGERSIVVSTQSQTSLPRFFRLANGEKPFRYAAMDMTPLTCRTLPIDPSRPDELPVQLKSTKENTLIFPSSTRVAEELKPVLEGMLVRSVHMVPSRWDIFMVPTNCLFHTAFYLRYLEMQERKEAVPDLFYRGVTQHILDTIQKMSNNLKYLMLVMRTRLTDCTFPYNADVKKYLEAKYAHQLEGVRLDPEGGLKEIFLKNPPYQVSKTPKNADGSMNLQSRYIWEDVPFGLMTWMGIAKILDVEMPDIAETVFKLQKVMGKEYIVGGPWNWDFGKDFRETGAPQRFGITTLQDLREF